MQLNFRKAERTITTLKTILRQARSADRFKTIWDAAVSSAEVNELDGPELPRQRKVPARFTGSGQHHFAATPEDHYRKLYFEAMDSLIVGLDTRFESSETTEHLAKVIIVPILSFYHLVKM